MTNAETGAENPETNTENEGVADMLEFLPGVAELLPKGPVAEEEEKSEDEPEVSEVTEEAVEEATEEEAETAEESDETPKGLDPKTQAKIQKRIDKVVAAEKAALEKAEKAEARARELEEKLAGVRPVVVQPTAENPLADVATTGELQRRFDNAVAWKRWCIENPDGGEAPVGDGKTEEISAERARKILANAEEMLTVHIPKRSQYLTEHAKHEESARVAYPQLFQPQSEESVAMNALLQAWPEVQRFPDYKTVLGDYMAGKKLRESAAAKRVEPEKVKPKQKLAPPVPKAGASMPKNTTPKAPPIEQIKMGGEEALANYFAGAGA